ncbi:MAG: hypothetical protein ABWZ80_00500 [Beijerinckiaceae bacterium]
MKRSARTKRAGPPASRRPFTPLAPATIIAAKRLFEREGFAAKDIAERLEIHASTVTRYAKRDRWENPPSAVGAATARKATQTKLKSSSGVRAKRPLGSPERSGSATVAASTTLRARLGGLVARAVTAAEMQADDIERRLADASIDASEREREARSFAIFVRALRDLATLGESLSRGEAAAPSTIDEDEDLERVVDGYRAQFARVLAGMRREGPEPCGGADADAGAPDQGAGDELDLPGKT